MNNAARFWLAVVAFGGAIVAHADSSGVSAGGFTVTVARNIAAPPGRVYATLIEPTRWWNPQHTWSGDANNLNLEPVAGGCFCERWAGGSVEHGRVVYAAPGIQLRLLAALGPLQSLPVNAVLTFALAPAPGGTRLVATYLVAGGGIDLAPLAAPVDGVITEQVDRLAVLAVSGAGH